MTVTGLDVKSSLKNNLTFWTSMYPAGPRCENPEYLDMPSSGALPAGSLSAQNFNLFITKGQNAIGKLIQSSEQTHLDRYRGRQWWAGVGRPPGPDGVSRQAL